MSILSRNDILERILEGERELFKDDKDGLEKIDEILKNLESKEIKINQLFKDLYKEIKQNTDEKKYNERVENIERIVDDVREKARNKNTRKGIFKGILFDDFDSNLLQASSYDMRLGREIYTTDEKKPTKLGNGNDETMQIHPGEFGVFLTHEMVYIPINLLGFISLKSKYKLKGLVNVSGFHVDPGYYGKILFSVYNAGPRTIFLRYKEAVFMVMFDELKNDSKGYQKNGYKNIPVDIYSDLYGDPISVRALDGRIKVLEDKSKAVGWIIKIIIVAMISGLIGAIIAKYLGLI